MLRKRMRRAYTKPCIEKVQLVLEEAVLAGCKAEIISPGGPGGTSTENDCLGDGQCFWIQT